MTVSSRNEPAILQRVMQADRHRLLRQWQQLTQRSADNDRLTAWENAAQKSAELCEQRAARIPQLNYDPELPITAHRQQIIDLIQSRQVIVLCGETGSGKSTQLPKLCLEAGLGRRAMIGHTQPRRLAARAVSSRLAEELGSKVGELVGFKIRFTDATQPQTLIKVMTDGVLLAETQRDRFFDQYDAIIIDEAHERSLNIDFLLGYLKQLSGKRPDLKLIITSATIDPERFANHFADEQGPAPIIEVSGRTYPVEMRYRPIVTDSIDEEPDEQMQLSAIADACDELLHEGAGDVLVFLPTERDIRIVAKHLGGHHKRAGNQRGVETLPLYARLSQADQNKIFQPHNQRRIILATNVAESSLTVPGIHYVVDTGLARISRYAPRSKVQRLPIEAVSQASANQRSGRCGRLGPGVCIRLFSQQDYESRSQFTTPEIRRSDLAAVLLQSLVLRLGPLDEFPLLDPPAPEAIRDAEKTLRELDAIDARGELTKVGRQLGALPCDPRVGRMLIEANERNCLPEVLIIAAAIETQDPRQRPAGQAPQADEAHAMFLDPHSDFLSYLRLWDFYERLGSDLGRSRLQKALHQRFLSHNNFREWADIVRQLKELLHSSGMKVGQRKIKLPPIDLKKQAESLPDTRSQGKHQRHVPAAKPEVIKRPEGYDAIHQSLLAGLLSGIANASDNYEYKAAGGMSLSLWPGSGLFRRKPKWIMAAEIVETTKRFARTIAEVDVDWIEHAARDLLKHSYYDPHWSSKIGAAMVYRRSTLYGLPIVVGRRVNLAPINAVTAREMLIEHGLVAGEWSCREKFYAHNQELLADMNELAQRTRERQFIVDKYQLERFYAQRIPAEVTDLNSLRTWMNKNPDSPLVKSLWMTPEDLIADQEKVKVDFAAAFPNELQVGSTKLPLAYHFEPGNKADGVTVTVPQAALRQISDEALAWLVPGLLEDKLLYLIRSLPKNLRTNFVPAPDVAKSLAAELNKADRQRPFSTVLCELLSRRAGEPIRASDFDWTKLPEHLQFLVRVVDDSGNVVETSRNVAELQSQYAPPESMMATKQVATTSDWKDRRITQVDFDSLPAQVGVRRGGLIVAAFPALVDVGDAVELRLVDHATEAERLSLQGWNRLFALKHHRNLRGQVAHLPDLEKSSVLLGHVLKSDQLRMQLQDLIARIAFIENQTMPQNRDDFELRNMRAVEQISIATQNVAAWLPRFSESAHEVRKRVEALPATWREIADDIRDQLKELFAADFLKVTPWSALVELPRYLRAIELRLDKLKAGGLPKDKQLRTPIEKAVKRFRDVKSQPMLVTPEVQARLDQLRWLIEEFRVSIFAQSLGTKQTVSEKRINEFLDSLNARPLK